MQASVLVETTLYLVPCLNDCGPYGQCLLLRRHGYLYAGCSCRAGRDGPDAPSACAYGPQPWASLWQPPQLGQGWRAPRRVRATASFPGLPCPATPVWAHRGTPGDGTAFWSWFPLLTPAHTNPTPAHTCPHLSYTCPHLPISVLHLPTPALYCPLSARPPWPSWERSLSRKQEEPSRPVEDLGCEGARRLTLE